MEEIKKQMRLIYEIMGEESFADAVATMLWNIYCKCKEKGFSEEQSMAVTINFAKSQSNK